jgi:GNAT superfamily N-acetyltransferase
MLHLLDNIVWHALTGAQAKFASGDGGARRYARGFSPIVGFADVERPDFAALARHCDPGEHFYCDGWTGTPTAGWHVEAETTMFKMVWHGGLPPPAGEPVQPLQAAHAAQAFELAALTRPGPFGPRTIELGDYIGAFDGEQLVAMAGERMQAGPLREISGVCTHPRAQGRGLARRLMLELVRRQLQRGETPFLHVMRANVVAHSLYQRMGFADHRESVVRVIARMPD